VSRSRVVPVLLVAMLAVFLISAHAFGPQRRPASALSTPERDAPAVVAVEYDLGDTAFTDPPQWTAAAELKAVVRFPRVLPPGRLPLIVLVHGQHYPCAADGEADWPCPPGVEPIPSYRGFDYLGEALAGRGFVVVSLSANGINAHGGGAPQRAHLINRHLALWQQFDATGGGPLAGRFTDAHHGRTVGVDLTGRIDLTRVGTMGHAAGGTAVVRQAADAFRGEWPTGVRIRAVAPIAADYFDADPDDTRGSTVTTVPLAVLSAGCRGDSDHRFFANARRRNAVPVHLMTLPGANHSFLNTVWSPSGGVYGASDDSTCPQDPGKLSETTERAAAIAYLTAFYEWALKGAGAAQRVLTGARPLGVPGVTGIAQVQRPSR
jgi:dienelactone hydrolase